MGAAEMPTQIASDAKSGQRLHRGVIQLQARLIGHRAGDHSPGRPPVDPSRQFGCGPRIGMGVEDGFCVAKPG